MNYSIDDNDTKIVALKEVIEYIVDNRGKTPPLSESGIPLIEVNALGTLNIEYSKVSKYIDKFTYDNFLRKYLKKNDILFSTVGNTAVTSIYNEDIKSAIAQNIVAFRINSAYDYKYIYQLLSFDRNVRYIKKIQMNGVQPSLKVTQLVDVKLKVHFSLDQQQKIGILLSAMDKLIEYASEQSKNISNQKSYMLSKIFNNGIEDKKVVRLGDIVDIIDGDRGKNYPSKKDMKEVSGTLFLSATNISKNGFSSRELNFISNEHSKKMSKGKVKTGDIVITSRGTVGNVGLFQTLYGFQNIRINSGMLILRPYNKLYSETIYHYLKSRNFIYTLKNITSGSAQPQLTKADMNNIKINSSKKSIENIKIGNLLSAMDKLQDLYDLYSKELSLAKNYNLNKIFG